MKGYQISMKKPLWFLTLLLAGSFLFIQCGKDDNTPTGATSGEGSQISVGFEDSPYQNIQEAIDNVPEGSTIKLAPKTFSESIRLYRFVKIEGTIEGGDTTIIRNQTLDNGSFKTTVGGDIVVGINLMPFSYEEWNTEDTIIKNVVVDGYDAGIAFAGFSGAPLIISNVAVRHCKCYGIVGWGEFVVTSNCQFELNSGDSLSVFNIDVDSVRMENCIFRSNTITAPSDCNGAPFPLIDIEAKSYAIENSLFLKNRSHNIAELSGNGLIRNCEFRSCSPPSTGEPKCSDVLQLWGSDGGVYVRLENVLFMANRLKTIYSFLSIDDTIQITNCQFIGNECPSNGYNSSGLVRMHMTNAIIENCDFMGNNLDPESAGGISLGDMQSLCMDNTIIAANGGGFTAGLSYYHTGFEVTHCTIAFNRSSMSIDHPKQSAIDRQHDGANNAAYQTGGAMVRFANSIIAYNAWGIHAPAGDLWEITYDCIDVFGNGIYDAYDVWNVTDFCGVCEPGAEYVCGCVPAGNNLMSVDPMFQDPGNLDFSFKPNSPLLNTSCGTIGATR